MISFVTFFMLTEAAKKKVPQKVSKAKIPGFNGVPRGAMGVATSAEKLPDAPPYGFWVDRSGNFIAVPNQKHNAVAASMIDKANKWLIKDGQDPIKIFDHANDPYDRLFQHGWVRVVFKPEAKQIYYNGQRGVQPTDKQMSFLEFIKDLYEMENLDLRF